MIKTVKQKRGLASYLDKSHSELLKKFLTIQERLTLFFYEDEYHFKENRESLKDLIRELKKELSHHMDIEEKIIFPYLRSHIPKLQFVIYFLEAEHLVLKNNFHHLYSAINRFSTKGKGQVSEKKITKIKEYIDTFNLHIQGHFQKEEIKVYWAIKNELRPEERRELARKIKEKS